MRFQHAYAVVLLSVVALVESWPQLRNGIPVFSRVRGPSGRPAGPIAPPRSGMWGFGIPQRFIPATLASQSRPQFAFMKGPQHLNRGSGVKRGLNRRSLGAIMHSRSGMIHGGHRLILDPLASQMEQYTFVNGPQMLKRLQKPSASHNLLQLQALMASPQWKAQAYRNLVKDQRPLTAAGQPTYEFLNLRSPTTMLVPIRIDGDRGPIRTIPAPNLSLADKPIIVMPETSNHLETQTYVKPGQLSPKGYSSYEVTEATHDPASAHSSHQNTELSLDPFHSAHQALSFAQPPLYDGVLTSADLLQLLRGQNQQQQLADTYSLPLLQQPQLLRHTALGSNVRLQAFNPVLQTIQGRDPQALQQSVLFKPDPTYVHKLQGQFLHHPLTTHSGHYQIKPESLGQAEALQADKEHDQSGDTTITQYNVARKTRGDSAVSIQPKGFQASQPDHIISQNTNTNITPAETTVSLVVTKPPLEMKDDAVSPTFYSQIGKTDTNIIASGFYPTVTNEVSNPIILQNDANQNSAQSILEEKLSVNTAATDFKPYIEQSVNDKKNKSEELFRPIINEEHQAINNGLRAHTSTNESSENQSPIQIYISEPYDDIETQPPQISSRHDNVSTEHVVRIYSNYDKPSESLRTKSTEKPESLRGSQKHSASISSLSKFLEEWRSGIKAETQKISTGAAINHINEFGQKLRPKMDDHNYTILEAE